MRCPRVVLPLILVGSVVACHHATINTGLKPSPTTIDKPWTSSWVLGLVPPATVKAAAVCTNGVARVETRVTFLNMLASWFTAFIYTPMHVRITCAAGGAVSLESEGTMEVEADAGPEQIREALSKAFALSKENGAAVYVVMR